MHVTNILYRLQTCVNPFFLHNIYDFAFQKREEILILMNVAINECKNSR